MKSQQAAEREEQQRIKNLVLRYDLHDENDQHDGTKEDPWLLSSRGLFNEPLLHGNPNTKGLTIGPDNHHGGSNRSRRNKPQTRKLNLHDVDWYGNSKTKKKAEPAPEQDDRPLHYLDAFMKPTKAQRENKKKPG
jgi:regulator of nonsense transcripts 2